METLTLRNDPDVSAIFTFGEVFHASKWELAAALYASGGVMIADPSGKQLGILHGVLREDGSGNKFILTLGHDGGYKSLFVKAID